MAGTYLNAWEMTRQVRYGLNEFDVYDENYIEGVDQSGAYQNEYIMHHLNKAQAFIWNMIFKKEKGIFLKSDSITGVDSVFTLPWDFGAVAEFRDENGYKVYPVRVEDFAKSSATGSDLLYYRKGNTFVLDKSGVNQTYTLWYYYKPRDLDMGSCISGTATTIKLAETAKKYADYYNGMTIENKSSDWTGAITDYDSSRVATVSSSSSDGDFYGLVSELPEPFHVFIVDRAVMTIKAQFPASFEEPSNMERNFFVESLMEALNSYAGMHDDIPIEDIVTDFPPYVPIHTIYYD